MEILSHTIENITTFLWNYIATVLLIVSGIYFSFTTGIVQLRFLRQMIPLLFEKNEDSKGMSSFQAFAVSTATRVGTGNIAGVAVAIAIGGPGSVFWMWILAFLGASSAFAETVLGQIYKRKTHKGFIGGPAYYIKNALKNKPLSVVFALLLTVTFGLGFPAVASNTISYAFDQAFHIPKYVTGILIFILTIAVIFRGRESIVEMTEKMLPLMAFLYLGVILVVIIMHINQVPHIFALIVSSGLGFHQFAGATIGVTVIQGVRRGLFSNEAGIGSTPNASSSADISHPVKQGIVQMLSVYIDTIVICTLTAFLILIAKEYLIQDPNNTGIVLVQKSLVSQLGHWGTYFIAICIFLFGYSTILGDCFYAESNIHFLKIGKVGLNVFRFIIAVSVGLAAILNLGFIINLTDLLMGLLGIVNIYSLLRLGHIVKACLNDYLKQKKQGKNPRFKAHEAGIHLRSHHTWV